LGSTNSIAKAKNGRFKILLSHHFAERLSPVRDFKLPLNRPFKLAKIEKPDTERLRELRDMPFQLDVKIYELNN
jgi:hypothetical protein